MDATKQRVWAFGTFSEIAEAKVPSGCYAIERKIDPGTIFGATWEAHALRHSRRLTSVTLRNRHFANLPSTGPSLPPLRQLLIKNEGKKKERKKECPKISHNCRPKRGRPMSRGGG